VVRRIKNTFVNITETDLVRNTVITVRRILDIFMTIVMTVLVRSIDGSLRAPSSGNDAYEKRTNRPDLGHQHGAESSAVPLMDSEAVDRVQSGVQRSTPWTKAAPPHQEKAYLGTGRPV
jgi:hypothetical protein